MSEAQRSVTVAIEGIEVRCHCGVTDEERRDAQLLLVDLRVAPLMRAFIARDGTQGRWLLLLLIHHLASDHYRLGDLYHPGHFYLHGVNHCHNHRRLCRLCGRAASP